MEWVSWGACWGTDTDPQCLLGGGRLSDARWEQTAGEGDPAELWLWPDLCVVKGTL